MPTIDPKNHEAIAKETPEVPELAKGESIDHWAERFASTMEERESVQERKRPRWTPLSILGLQVR